MLAKKSVPGDKRAITRDKEAKISAIIEATRRLIETVGYEKMTIRDIAEEADVSVGLIYKYFPGGKFEILARGFGGESMDRMLKMNVGDVDLNDFPGYMRALIKYMQQIFKQNEVMMKALIAASLLGGDMAVDVKNIDINDYARVAEFFCNFKGVDAGDKDPVKLLLYWGTCIKGTFISCLMYPLPPGDEDAIAELLVDQSLRIWGYKSP
jgi:AcrR family transcriptional regulator